MKKRLLLLLLIFPCIVYSQQDYRINAEKINTPIVLDGNLDDTAWQKAKVYAESFHQYFPADSVPAEDQTTIKMVFDDKNLYVAIECFSRGTDYVIPTLRRDYRAGGNDNITLMIDPFNEGINAFMFGVNPAGVKREGLISNGGTGLNGFSTSWDNKWECKTEVLEDRWVTEMAIPFSTLRFNKDNQQWKFNSYRFDMQANERTTWVQIPRNQWIFSLGYMGTINFSEPITADGSKVSIIPYVNTGYSKDYEADTEADYNFNTGGDAKIAITSGLNLDITANPDFSQVEVDRQVTNLSRFEIFFPERRQFFLENADLFGSFGTRGNNPFFTRRIGIAQDTSTDDNIQNTIYGGARLSGKINDKWRLGLLNMVTAKDELAAQPSLNFSVLSSQRRIGERSNIGLLLVNRDALGASDTDAVDKYNRVIGIDYNLATVDNLWNGKTFLHKSFSVNQGSKTLSHGFNMRYNKRRYRIDYEHNYVGADYDAQVGFVRRTNFYSISPEFRYYFYPRSGPMNRVNLFSELEQIYQPDFGKTDEEIQFGVNAEFISNMRMDVSINRRYLFLMDDFDPTGTDSEPLPAGTDYSFVFVEGGFNSDNSKPLSIRFNPYIGQYFSGKRYGARGNLNYRVEPYGSVSFNYNYNIFDMPYLDENKSTLLLGPRFDFTFTKSIFVTTFIQYNSQSQNTNINARFQWRFAPVSDFFLVYSDNYLSGNVIDPSDRFAFDLENRSIVAKVTYWLNM